MKPILKPTRYAHSEGHTDLCFSQDLKYIITCGSEGDVRIWTDLEDDEPRDRCVGEKAFAVCQRGTKLFVGTDSNNVQVLTFPDGELDGIVTRFTAPVTHIDASLDGKIVVSASCDMTINVTDTETSRTTSLQGHRAPVLSVALDPKMEYVASSSCDGCVKIWRLSDQSVCKTWECVPKSNSFNWAAALCRMSWQPTTGKFLAVPEKNEVKLYERDSWTNVISFGDPVCGSQLLSVTCFSCCGGYLAASTTQGHIIIWNVAGRLICNIQIESKQKICALSWCQTKEKSQLAYCDVTGYLGTVEQFLTVKEDSVVDPADIPLADPVFGDTDDDDDDAISLEKIKSESGFGAAIGLDDDDKKSLADGEDGRISRSSVKIMPHVELQPPFQPSSTPVHLQHRYMVWNDVGIVRQFNTEDENTIDVEFNDTGHHHGFRLNNLMGHTIASLSLDALVLCCESQDDSPSKVQCIMLNAWDGSKEWIMQLPAGEDALAVAVNGGWIAVATDTRMLRIYTVAGTQREIISLPGPVVCLAGKNDKLAAVFHTGISLNSEQCLSYAIITIGTPRQTFLTESLVSPLPLSPKTTLRWLGYSDEGTLFSLDSAGCLRLLSPSMLWRPVLLIDDQCKGKSDHYFVIGISESIKKVRCTLCKGSFYPPTTPRPTLVEVSLKIPMCESSIEKSELEEEFWSSHLVLPGLDLRSQTDEVYNDYKENINKVIKKTIMKLFALACQSGLEMRALELCEMMPLQVVQLAIKYVSKLGKVQLAERISEIASRKSEEEARVSLSKISSSILCSGTNASLSDATTKRKHDEAEGYSHQMSQDMFAEDTNTSSDGFIDLIRTNAIRNPVNDNLCIKSSQNLIVSLKQKTCELKTNEDSGSIVKRINPFKKLADSKDETKKGLNGLMKVQAPLKKNISNSLAKAPSSVKQTKQIMINNSGKSKKTPFKDWYETEKQNLQKEFPELSTTELTKVAIKRFKSQENPEKSESEKTVSEKPASFQGLKKFLFTPSPVQNNSSEDSKLQDETKKRKLSPSDNQSPQEKKTK